LDKGYADLLNALENEGDVVGAARNLSELTVRFLDDVKGFIPLIPLSIEVFGKTNG
jgi:hypothetical protein